MHYRKLTLLLPALLLVVSLAAQTTNPAPDRANDPRAYPLATSFNSPSLQRFDAQFDETNVGFLHVYADPNVDPAETYLLRGEPMSEVATALLPKKYRKMARKLNADVYAAAAIRGMNENMYLVRMDGDGEDRIELFAIRGEDVQHLQTLAVLRKKGARTKQMDAFITDIDGDSYFEIMTMERRDKSPAAKKSVYVLTRPDRTWKKTTKLDAPWDSAEFFEPEMD